MKKKQNKKVKKEVKAWAIIFPKVKGDYEIDEKTQWGLLIFRTKKDAENEAYENEKVVKCTITYEI